MHEHTPRSSKWRRFVASVVSWSLTNPKTASSVSTFMTDELPICSLFAEHRDGYRVWKRILRDGGKQRAFELLEPRIRSLTRKIRNRMHPCFANEDLVPPTERKRKLLAAFDEIRASSSLRSSNEIVSDFGAFIYGTTGLTLHVLFAGASLVQAMLAKRGFERHLIACVAELNEVDAEFVQDVGKMLQTRPT